jgi:hypothetical protein
MDTDHQLYIPLADRFLRFFKVAVYIALALRRTLRTLSLRNEDNYTMGAVVWQCLFQNSHVKKNCYENCSQKG